MLIYVSIKVEFSKFHILSFYVLYHKDKYYFEVFNILIFLITNFLANRKRFINRVYQRTLFCINS